MLTELSLQFMRIGRMCLEYFLAYSIRGSSTVPFCSCGFYCEIYGNKRNHRITIGSFRDHTPTHDSTQLGAYSSEFSSSSITNLWRPQHEPRWRAPLSPWWAIWSAWPKTSLGQESTWVTAQGPTHQHLRSIVLLQVYQQPAKPHNDTLISPIVTSSPTFPLRIFPWHWSRQQTFRVNYTWYYLFPKLSMWVKVAGRNDEMFGCCSLLIVADQLMCLISSCPECLAGICTLVAFLMKETSR